MDIFWSQMCHEKKISSNPYEYHKVRMFGTDLEQFHMASHNVSAVLINPHALLSLILSSVGSI